MKPDLKRSWRTSSYSNQGNCVEVSRDEQGLLARDSKAPNGGMLVFADKGASAFLAAVKAGQYQR